MTSEQIKAVFERVGTWPRSRQEDAAQLLLAMEAQDTSPYALSDEERADLQAALDEVARGEIASDGEIAALFARYGA